MSCYGSHLSLPQSNPKYLNRIPRVISVQGYIDDNTIAGPGHDLIWVNEVQSCYRCCRSAGFQIDQHSCWQAVSSGCLPFPAQLLSTRSECRTVEEQPRHPTARECSFSRLEPKDALMQIFVLRHICVTKACWMKSRKRSSQGSQMLSARWLSWPIWLCQAASIKSCLLQLPVSTHGQCADLKTQKYVTSFPAISQGLPGVPVPNPAFPSFHAEKTAVFLGALPPFCPGR